MLQSLIFFQEYTMCLLCSLNRGDGFCLHPCVLNIPIIPVKKKKKIRCLSIGESNHLLHE